MEEVEGAEVIVDWEDGVEEVDGGEDEDDADSDVDDADDSEVEGAEEDEEDGEAEELELETEEELLLLLLLLLEADETLNDVNDTEATLVDEVVCDAEDLLDVDEEREEEISALEEETKLDDDKVLDNLSVFVDENPLDIADELEDDDCTKNCACIVEMNERNKNKICKVFLPL